MDFHKRMLISLASTLRVPCRCSVVGDGARALAVGSRQRLGTRAPLLKDRSARYPDRNAADAHTQPAPLILARAPAHFS
jgi:hypothetical protein